MSDSPTPRLALPMLQPGQAQKEMSHNDALVRLDLAAQAAVHAAGTNIPPDAPEFGDAWILGSAPTGDWAGNAHAIAGWTAGGWRYLTPCEGMRAWVIESDGFALFRSGEWHLGEAHGRLIVDGEQVVGGRADAIDDPDGGTVIDIEARDAITAILAAMRGHGLLETA